MRHNQVKCGASNQILDVRLQQLRCMRGWLEHAGMSGKVCMVRLDHDRRPGRLWGSICQERVSEGLGPRRTCIYQIEP